MILASVLPMSAKTIKGSVLDKEGNPIGGATCVCFSLPDSSFVDVVTTVDSGFFMMDVPDFDWYMSPAASDTIQIVFQEKIFQKHVMN